MKLYDTVDDLITAIDDHLLALRKNGGQLPFPIMLDWSGEQADETRVFRLSNSGKCPRQMAYNLFYPDEREELSARALNVFIHGDLLHEKERQLIRQVTHLTRVEERVELKVNNDLTVIGHIDGVIYIDKKPMILDIKSINTRGFKEAVDGFPRPDYIAQVNGYMAATGTNKAVLWMYNKDTSHRAALIIDRDEEVIRGVKERFLGVKNSNLDNLPDRMYEPQEEISRGKLTGREYLPWQCGYCPFVARCWEDTGFELIFDKGKPRWMRGEVNNEN